MNKLTLQRILRNKSAGFSLLEVLVALLVLSVGLLGLAALQAVALKSNHGAYQRSQATFLAYDIIDRMRANRVLAISGSYNLAMASAPSGSTTLAQQDLVDWMDNFVAVLLPAGDGSIACTTAAVCTVVVQWDASRQGGTAAAGNNTASFTFMAEI